MSETYKHSSLYQQPIISDAPYSKMVDASCIVTTRSYLFCCGHGLLQYRWTRCSFPVAETMEETRGDWRRGARSSLSASPTQAGDEGETRATASLLKAVITDGMSHAAVPLIHPDLTFGFSGGAVVRDGGSFQLRT